MAKSKTATVGLTETHKAIRQLAEVNGIDPSWSTLREGASPLMRVIHFFLTVKSGGKPDAEAIGFVADAFERYIAAQGRLSLDDAFGLLSKKGVGNPSAQFAKDSAWLPLLVAMAVLQSSDPSLRNDAAAELAFSALPEDIKKTLPKNPEETAVRYFSKHNMKRLVELLRNGGK